MMQLSAKQFCESTNRLRKSIKMGVDFGTRSDSDEVPPLDVCHSGPKDTFKLPSNFWGVKENIQILNLVVIDLRYL